MPERRDVQELLDELGLAVGANGAEMTDFDLSGNKYIHHTRMPVALAGYAQVIPSFAAGRFPDTTLLQLVSKRPSMDEHEAMALAAVCGADAEPPFWGRPEPFVDCLLDVSDRYGLANLFITPPEGQPEGTRLNAFRPRGFDWNNMDRPEIPGAIAQWRRDYRLLPTEKQMMVATILQLYMQREDKIWLVRVPKKWRAADAVVVLDRAGYLKDWAKLIALYPGW